MEMDWRDSYFMNFPDELKNIKEKFFIADFFKNYSNGRFLEIGSNDGDPEDDNEPVWPLVKMGWSGIYCEPNPHACSKLLHNLKSYRGIEVVNCAVADKSELQKFYIADDFPMASSFDVTWIPNTPYITSDTKQYSIFTNTITMYQLVNSVGTDFDCISIDVEAYDRFYTNLIKSFDWRLFDKCKVIVIECMSDFVINYFCSIGYKCIGKSVYNAIFVR